MILYETMTPDQSWSDDEWNNFRSQVKDVLVEGVGEVTFTKINGDERVMTCTLRPQDLPKVEIKEGEERNEMGGLKKERVIKNPNNSLAVFDLKADGWRSFVIKNIKSVRVPK